jgi:hypothetical protein
MPENYNKERATLNLIKVIYNLQGVRMNTAKKGVYIINGKKVVMK